MFYRYSENVLVIIAKKWLETSKCKWGRRWELLEDTLRTLVTNFDSPNVSAAKTAALFSGVYKNQEAVVHKQNNGM